MSSSSRPPAPTSERAREEKRARSSSHDALAQAVLARSVSMLEPANLRSLFESAALAAGEFFPLEACEFAVLRPDARRADLYVAIPGRAIEHQSCRSDEGLLRQVLQSTDVMVLTPDELRRHAHPLLDAALLREHTTPVVLVPLKDASGRVCGAFMCAASRSERETAKILGRIRLFALQLEAALALLQARHDLRHWNAIVRASHDAIVGYDLDGRVTHWNPGAERLYGYSAQEAIGEHMAFLVPEDRGAERDEIERRITQGQYVEPFDTVRLTKDGRRVDVSLSVSPIYDSVGQRVGASSIARDITLQKHASERFRLAVESAPNAMLLSDEQGRIVLANAEAEELFGYTREELVGNPIEMLLPGDVRAAHREHRTEFHQRPEKRAMGVGRDLWALRKDGTRVPVEVGLNPIQEEAQRSVLASIVDISERHKIERERQRLLKEAQQAVTARDSFMSIASHELKTPLTALQLTLQALRRKIASGEQMPTGIQLAEKLTAASRQVTRLGALIDQLLDVSRITAGRLSLEFRRTNLTELVQAVVERFVQGLDNCTILAPDHEPVWGHWDASRVDQIFTNLLSNAVKYGNGKPIDVQIADRGADVVVAIRDRGGGIAPEDQARIFERFERLVSHRHHEGFGLGLWIVRQLVEAHRGRIEVHSEPGKGSTFIVTLPKALAGPGTTPE